MILNYVVALALFLPFCVSIDTITLNQSLKDGEFLISERGTFALGFFSPGKSSYRYLGIWYYKLPGQTVVWVANRNSPINSSSGLLSVNQDGNLALYVSHEQKFPVWSTNVSRKVADDCVAAQLLDSGNLVLVQDRSKRIVWQSFDYPTDTIIPGMFIGLDRKIGVERFLTSGRSADDPGTGDYSFKLNIAGSPQFFVYKGFAKRWRSRTWPWTDSATPSKIESKWHFELSNNQEGVLCRYVVSDESVITRSLISGSGLFQVFIWNNNTNQWKESWSQSKYNYGHCGPNSMCNANNVEPFECRCLPGYEPKSMMDWSFRDGSQGCVRKRQQKTSMCRNGEGFVEVRSVKYPDPSAGGLLNRSISSGKCRQLCLENCTCTAFAKLDIDGKGLGCLTWHEELMDTTEETGERDIYVRVDSVELAENVKMTRGFFRKNMNSAILVYSVALTMFLIVLSSYLWLRKKRETKAKERWTKRLFANSVADELVGSRKPPHVPFFDLGTISAAINNFSPATKLGQGGFGSVYKGQLPDGLEIAVKRLSQSSRQGLQEFKNEVMLIARLQHRNLVKLLGCCIDREEQMLIYEYLPNKSLDFFVFDEGRRSPLDWRKRFDIIVGIARGIVYLHHDSRLRIVHRDLKTSNVLLDAEMNPKISDFGTARIFDGGQVQEKTKRVVGTFGYMSPEYVTFGKFSIKSDVFSFGVILLEIVSGKKNITSEDPSLNLVAQVWDRWRNGRGVEIVDSFLTESSVPPELFRCIQIGLLCVQEEAADRPTMAEVLLMLTGETALPCPKQPAFIFRRNGGDPFRSSSRGRPCSINKVTITQVLGR